MQICSTHWDMLRLEIRRQGLENWVAKDGETAVLQFKDQITKQEDTATNYDPLMSCNYMIMTRTIEIAGPAAIHKDFGCPICRLNSLRNPDGSCNCTNPNCPARFPGAIMDHETWLTGPDSCVAAAKEHMIERGWIKG